MFGMLVATAAMLPLPFLKSKMMPARRISSPAFAVLFLLVATLAASGLTSVYGSIASQGLLGQKAREKYELQTQGSASILLAGRNESFASTRAIADSPFIGHGSWAEDRYYAMLKIQRLRDRGYEQSGIVKTNLIPTHSYLLGSWVEAGISGAIIWIFALGVTYWALVCTVDIRSPALPFVVFSLVQLLWNIPFSPFGAASRFYASGQLCIAIWAITAAAASYNVEMKNTPLKRQA